MKPIIEVNMLELVSGSDIARQYQLTVPSVSYWMKSSDFPAPVATYGASKRPLFAPEAVQAWVERSKPKHAAKALEVQS